MSLMVPMIMAVGLSMPVGAAFRVEWSVHRRETPAEFFHHILDHVIPADAQGLAHELGRQMPVAQMPGDLDQVGGVVRRNFHQFLRLGQHFHDPAIFKHKPVSVAQVNGRRFVEKKGQAIGSRQHSPPPVPVFPVKGNFILCRPGPIPRPAYSHNTDHAASLSLAVMALKPSRMRRRLK